MLNSSQWKATRGEIKSNPICSAPPGVTAIVRKGSLVTELENYLEAACSAILKNLLGVLTPKGRPQPPLWSSWREGRGEAAALFYQSGFSQWKKHICIARIKGFKTGNQKLTQWLEGLGKQYENCCYLHEIKKGWIPVKLLTITPAVYNTKAGDSQEVAWELEQIVCLPYVQASVHSCQQG